LTPGTSDRISHFDVDTGLRLNEKSQQKNTNHIMKTIAELINESNNDKEAVIVVKNGSRYKILDFQYSKHDDLKKQVQKKVNKDDILYVEQVRVSPNGPVTFLWAGDEKFWNKVYAERSLSTDKDESRVDLDTIIEILWED
jgi:hypothetical protein